MVAYPQQHGQSGILYHLMILIYYNEVPYFMQIHQNQCLTHRDSSSHFAAPQYLSSTSSLCKTMYEKEINGLRSKYCLK